MLCGCGAGWAPVEACPWCVGVRLRVASRVCSVVGVLCASGVCSYGFRFRLSRMARCRDAGKSQDETVSRMKIPYHTVTAVCSAQWQTAQSEHRTADAMQSAIESRVRLRSRFEFHFGESRALSSRSLPMRRNG